MARGYSMWPMAVSDQGYGRPLGVTSVQTAASVTSQIFFNGSPVPFRIRILDIRGVMTGAGAGGDTVKVTDGTNDLTDTADLSALADTDTFDMSQLDDAYWIVDKGDNLTCVTASDALCYVTAYCVREE